MKKKGRSLRTGPDKYVTYMGRALAAVGIVVLPALMIMLVYAVNLEGGARVGFALGGAAAALGFLALYGVYALNVSMGTVIGIEVTEKVVHITTRRKVFTYDVRMGCVAVKKKGKKIVCTFETQDSRDKFIFYLHAPLTKYSDSQFTEDDIRSFCPRYDEILVESDSKS